MPEKFKLATRMAAATSRCVVPSPNTLRPAVSRPPHQYADQQQPDHEEDQGQEAPRADEIDDVGDV